MHFAKFHPKVASCLLSRGKRKYAPLGMRLLWKYRRNYFLVYHLISHFLLYLQNYREFGAEILDLQSEKYVLSFDIKKYTTSSWALRDENVIDIRAFKTPSWSKIQFSWAFSVIHNIFCSKLKNFQKICQYSAPEAQILPKFQSKCLNILQILSSPVPKNLILWQNQFPKPLHLEFWAHTSPPEKVECPQTIH